MKTKLVNIIEDSEWDKLVISTYGKPYAIQQQNGCVDPGIVYFSVPNDEDELNYISNNVIPHADFEDEFEMCVKFEDWINRDPEEKLEGEIYDWSRKLWWTRHFYPCIYALANDLYKRGILQKGDYGINIDY